MSEREPTDYRPPPERSFGPAIVFTLLLVAAAWFGWHWWQSLPEARQSEPVGLAPLAPPDGLPPSAQSPVASPDAPPADPAVAAPASAPRYPIESSAAQPEVPAAATDALWRRALGQLLGSETVARFLQTDGFARRVAATVDNLPREQAPTMRWPVHPAQTRFQVSGAGQDRVIDPSNSERYEPFVRLAESIDAAQAAALYRKHYPLFQQAYEELGYPGRYFNDRLVAAIDHLLAAPEPAGPVRLSLVDVKGSVASTQPWTRYEFDDPELEALSSGQKMMVRMGLGNQRRLKDKLREVRALITAPPESRTLIAAPDPTGPTSTLR